MIMGERVPVQFFFFLTLMWLKSVVASSGPGSQCILPVLPTFPGETMLEPRSFHQAAGLLPFQTKKLISQALTEGSTLETKIH